MDELEFRGVPQSSGAPQRTAEQEVEAARVSGYEAAAVVSAFDALEACYRSWDASRGEAECTV